MDDAPKKFRRLTIGQEVRLPLCLFRDLYRGDKG